MEAHLPYGSAMEEEAVRLAAATTLLLLFLIVFIKCLLIADRPGLPPSPPGRLPLLGHFHLLSGSLLPHALLHRISRKHSWPLFSLQLGQQSVVVASTPAAARLIIKNHDSSFAARPRHRVPFLLHGCGDILFASPDELHWKFLRQLSSSQLFIKKRLDTFHPVRSAELRSLCCSILGSARAPIDVRVQARALTGNIMSEMAFGKRLPELAPVAEARPYHGIIDLMDEMNQLLFVFNVSDCFPIFAKLLDMRGYGRQTRALAKRFDVVLDEIIHNRCHELSGHIDHKNRTQRKEDFLDLLLQSSQLLNKTAQLSDQNVRGVLMNIFGGGIDTAALTIEYALGELFANPAKMTKLQEELGQVVGMARLVEEADLPNLIYLQAVVKETMRLHPVVPLLAPRVATKTCEVMGYQVPANTVVYINAWAIGRDPETWESPCEFCPERFVGKEIDVSGQYYELLPFGSGRRGCPGWVLGLLMVQIAVANLVYLFDWETVNELDISEEYGLQITASNPLIARASPRLPLHLLQETDAQKNDQQV